MTSFDHNGVFVGVAWYKIVMLGYKERFMGSMAKGN